MQRAGLYGKRFLVLVVRYAQAIPLDLLDMLGPRIDKGDILAFPRHMRAGISTNCARADNGDLLAHGTPPHHCSGTSVILSFGFGQISRLAVENGALRTLPLI